jgi:hypothetical protein
MSATRDQRESAKAIRDDITDRAGELGHSMSWKLGPNATRRGYAYFFEGECKHCGAGASAGASWSSCSGIRDARRVECSGPGTEVLTEIETERAHQLVADAVQSFGEQVRENVARHEQEVIDAYERELFSN